MVGVDCAENKSSQQQKQKIQQNYFWFLIDSLWFILEEAKIRDCFYQKYVTRMFEWKQQDEYKSLLAEYLCNSLFWNFQVITTLKQERKWNFWWDLKTDW